MQTTLAFAGEDQRLESKLTFFDFWRAYPKRLGPNPRALAQKKYLAIVKSGTDTELIINGAKAYADELRALNQIGTVYVCHASTWLNQKRWLDYAPDPENKQRQAKIDADMDRLGYVWRDSRWQPK